MVVNVFSLIFNQSNNYLTDVFVLVNLPRPKSWSFPPKIPKPLLSMTDTISKIVVSGKHKKVSRNFLHFLHSLKSSDSQLQRCDWSLRTSSMEGTGEGRLSRGSSLKFMEAKYDPQSDTPPHTFWTILSSNNCLQSRTFKCRRSWARRRAFKWSISRITLLQWRSTFSTANFFNVKQMDGWFPSVGDWSRCMQRLEQ